MLEGYGKREREREERLDKERWISKGKVRSDTLGEGVRREREVMRLCEREAD